MADDIRLKVEEYLLSLQHDSQQWSDERVVIVRCRRCRNSIAEVMQTPFRQAGLVVVHRGFLRPDAPLPPLRETGKRDSQMHISVLANSIQNPFTIACRCGKHVIRAADLLSAIDDGHPDLHSAPARHTSPQVT
jgi:hypothetical protein